MTETSPVATIVPRGFAGKKRGSVGVPVPNSEIQVSNNVTGSSKLKATAKETWKTLQIKLISTVYSESEDS